MYRGFVVAAVDEVVVVRAAACIHPLSAAYNLYLLWKILDFAQFDEAVIAIRMLSPEPLVQSRHYLCGRTEKLHPAVICAFCVTDLPRKSSRSSYFISFHFKT
jgi:hypothetical protein